MDEQRGHPTSAGTVGFACLAMLVSYLPFSAANGALGAIAATTGAHTSDLQWVTDSFAVALAATVLSAGVLGDLYGRRRMTLLGLGLTGVGTALDVLAGVTNAVPLLWLGQALAGVGGGLVMATSSTVAVRSVPGPLAGMAAAGNNAMRQIGAALGPAVLGARTGTGLVGALHVTAALLAVVFATAAATAALLLRPSSARSTIAMTTVEGTTT